MKNRNNIIQLSIPGVSGALILMMIFFASLFLNSCKKELEYTIDLGSPIELTASASELVLSQQYMNSTALSFSWTTGTNHGTSSAIAYTLEIAKSGNDFSSALVYDMGKGVNEKSFSVEELNTLLLTTFNETPGLPVSLEARVKADVVKEGVDDGVSETISFVVTPYEPVTTTLYLIGSAAPNGWDASTATALTPDKNNPTCFYYQGAMAVGEFKFITTLGQYLPSYNKGADESHLFFRTDDAQADDKFTITESGNYSIVVDLLKGTISKEQLPGPAYEMLYIVGSATSIGWDIGNALEVPQNPDNLFQFIYGGVLVPGEFKFPVNRNTDWGQDMFMAEPADPSKIYLHNGGDADDNKWTIEKGNYYTITLDLSDYTIDIVPFKLYMVGSATPIGWDITSAIELVQDENEWYLFRYEGEMTEGEFKFPVNRQSDWGQDMYMKDPNDPTKMYRHTGGESDDSKWVFTAANAGNYIITVNVLDLTIDIQKQ